MSIAVDYQLAPQSPSTYLGQRVPQRQAYRLLELAHFRDHLGVVLNGQA